MSVFFKLHSVKEFQSLRLAGSTIGALEFKEQAVQRLGLGRDTGDFDLILTHAATGEEVVGDAARIPINSYIVLRRIHADHSRPGIMAHIRRTRRNQASVGVTVSQSEPAIRVAQPIMPRQTLEAQAGGVSVRNVRTSAARRALDHTVGVPMTQQRRIATAPSTSGAVTGVGEGRFGGSAVAVSVSSAADGSLLAVRANLGAAAGFAPSPPAGGARDGGGEHSGESLATGHHHGSIHTRGGHTARHERRLEAESSDREHCAVGDGPNYVKATLNYVKATLLRRNA